MHVLEGDDDDGGCFCCRDDIVQRKQHVTAIWSSNSHYHAMLKGHLAWR